MRYTEKITANLQQWWSALSLYSKPRPRYIISLFTWS